MATTASLRDTSRQDSLLDLSSLMNLSILIYGQGQMVWEVTRNLTLIGVKSITIAPPISSSPHQFNHYAFNTIQKLNPECKITLYSQPLSLQDLTQNLLPQHKLCILINILNQKDIVTINEACRSYSPEPIGFLSGSNLGFYSNIFVDFGPQFIVKDPYKSQRTFPIMGLNISNTEIQITTEDSSGLIRSGKFIKLKGITFKIAKTEFNEKLNLTVITLEATPSSDFSIDKKSCTSFELIIEPQIKKFESFKNSLSNLQLLQKGMEGPQKLPSKTLHHLYLTTLNFYETFQRLPNSSDHPQFLALYQEVSLQADLNKEILTPFLENLSYKSPPIASLFGALLANEALKISGTYIPLQQWLHFEEFFCAHNSKLQSLDPLHKISQPFISSNYILSSNPLKNFKIFIVGAGALGCEDLRLLAAMNACTGAQGKVYIADFDTISKSNLHRQALYGPHDVGKPKSLVASERIIEYNPQWEGKIEAFDCPVDNANIKTFPDDFWESLDVIIAAVDGVPARNFLQNQAKKYKKVFINAGTDGVRCTTGVYLPEKSEIYTGKESQGEATPSCTLKDHPYKIEHMIQYGCDRFKELFVEEVKGIRNAIQSIQDFDLEELESEDFDLDFEFNRSDLKHLIEMRNTPNYPLTKAFSILKAEIYDNINETITKFPRDSKDDHGNLVWRAPRRFPTPIELTPENPIHIDLVKFTANILAMSFGDNKNYTEQDIIKFLQNPQNMFIFESNKDKDFIAEIKQLKSQINQGELSTDLITFTEFDKDDDSRFHMDFLEAFTTVRAANYSIGTTTRDKIRSFAGKITPNMIITTSFAVSLTMLEVYKYSLGLNPEVFRGYHCNLAHVRFLPTILNENSPVEFNEKLAFKPWDVIEIPDSKKIGEIVKEIEEKYGINISCVKSEMNEYEIYYKKGEFEELLAEDLEEQESVKEMIGNGGKYVWLKIEVEKKRKEEFNGEFPVIKYVVKGREKEKTLLELENFGMNQCSVAPNP